MRKTNIFFKLMIFISIMFSHKVDAQDITGTWLGKMIINEQLQLRVAFEFTKDGPDTYKALMHSIDQNGYDMPVNEVNYDSDYLKLVINNLNATFTGNLKDGRIEGQMTQGNNKPWKLDLEKVGTLPRPKPKRPQYPEKPYPYEEELVTYQNVNAGVSLAGTFTYPAKGGKYPSVLLVPGSGPNDRDETIFGHKVFLVLADYLTRAGFAVLRVDDRGVGESSGDFNSASIFDLADDVLAGIDYLKTRNEVNPRKTGLVGHSLGAEISYIATNRSKEIDFIVLMSGSAISLEETIYEQCKAYYGRMVSEEAVQLNEKINKTVFDIVRKQKNNEAALKEIDGALSKLNNEVQKLNESDREILGLELPLSSKNHRQFLTPAMRTDLFHDNYDFIRNIKVPVLAMNGSLDLQVLPHNLALIRKALKEGGNNSYTIKEWVGKNHLFQNAQTGMPEEYSEIEETISPDVMEYIVNWIDKL